MSAFFVTATGTDIGKTFVTAALIHELRRRGREVAALKPVVSGFDGAARRRAIPACCLPRSASCRQRGALDAHRALALPRAAVARHGGGARGPSDRFRGAGRAFAQRDRGRAWHAADRGRRRRHGAARRAPHRARLDRGVALPAIAGGRQLSRHDQPHPDRARRAAPAAASPSRRSWSARRRDSSVPLDEKVATHRALRRPACRCSRCRGLRQARQPHPRSTADGPRRSVLG